MPCAFCGNKTIEILDYGDVALAGAFLKPAQFADEKRYPLSLHFCPECFAVQIPQRIRKETLFKDYFYRTSAIETMRRHFAEYAKHVVDTFHPKRVIEIGCNDGVMLKPLSDLGMEVVGVDPSNVSGEIDDERITVINGFWNKDIAKSIGKADMILANNVFAHIDDIKGATQAIADTLTDDGVFIFEVNRLDSLITENQYDWVYHEHLYYYSLLALDNHLANYGLMVFDLKRLPTHAGSMRYYVCKQGKRSPTKAVFNQREAERWVGLDKLERYKRFAEHAKTHRDEMNSLVSDLKSKGRVAGYGACGRANTMLQFCDIAVNYIVDDAPAKHGFYTPGTHIPVVPRSELKSGDPVIVFAWSFLQEIQSKVSGELIIPLPHIYRTKEVNAA